MKEHTKTFIFGIVAAIITILFSISTTVYDVAAIGPKGTKIGYSTVNKIFHETIGINTTWYQVTELLGYFALILVAIFAVVGLVQLIKRKSLLQVDACILAFGLVLIILLLVYVYFEKFPLNYRPIIMEGETQPEPSFPSSHTMLALVAYMIVFNIIPEYIDNKILSSIIRAVLVFLSIITVVGRLLSGVHWATDIIAGLLISCTLLILYDACESALDNRCYYEGAHYKK